MQVNLNTYSNQNNTYFGNLLNKSGNLLMERANNAKKYQIIDYLIHSKSDSKIYAEIRRSEKSKNRLMAILKDRNGTEYTMEESLLGSLFNRPEKFVKKVCDVMSELERK